MTNNVDNVESRMLVKPINGDKLANSKVNKVRYNKNDQPFILQFLL
jgi:spore cortex formation protein SpoVR/YcgB (stage V sporulation)